MLLHEERYWAAVCGRMEVAAWEEERNGKQKSVDWQFTTADARIKLRRLYQQIRA